MTTGHRSDRTPSHGASATPPTRPTPSQTVGPFFRFGLDWMECAELLPATRSDAVRITGTLYDGAGVPVPDAIVEIWQADPEGHFPTQAPSADQPSSLGATPVGWHGFGRVLTDGDGRFAFVTVKPGRVDGAQAPHVDVSVFARGLLQRLMTRIYFPDEVRANAADPVLGSIPDEAARATLVAEPDGDGLRFDIRLQGEGETVFLDW